MTESDAEGGARLDPPPQVWNHNHTRAVGRVVGREVRDNVLHLDLEVEGRRFTAAFPVGDVFAEDVAVPERIDVTGLYDVDEGSRVWFDPGTTRFSIEDPAVAPGEVVGLARLRTLAADMAAHRCPACGAVDCDNFVTLVTGADGESRVVHLDRGADPDELPGEPPC
jgi:hypothetical protein